jgi:hypothetical protein
LTILTDNIYLYDICDDEKVDNLFNRWEVEGEMVISDKEYTPESLGADPDCEITEEDIANFERMYILIEKEPKKAAKLLDELRAKWGNIPFVCYLELKYLETEKPKKYEPKLVEYSTLYPNYSLINLCTYRVSVLKLEDKSQVPLVEFENIFADRSSITNFEMFDFQSKKMFGILVRKDINELDAMYSAIDNIELAEVYSDYLKSILLLARISALKGILNIV